MNIVQVAGHLGADPEERVTPSGQKVVTLRIAANSRKSGKDETIWWRVTIWGDRFDRMLSYLKKGSGIIVIGEMNKPEVYNDRNGNPQVSLELTAEVIRFSPFGRSQGQTNTEPGSTTEQSGQTEERFAGVAAPAQGNAADGDDIPF